MTKYKYQCIREFLSNEDVGGYTSYAIVLELTKIRISDISTDRDFVLGIVRLLNKCRVDPIHLKDIVEDVIQK